MTAYEEQLVNQGWSPEEASVMYQKFSDPGFSRDPRIMREYQPGFLSVPQRTAVSPDVQAFVRPSWFDMNNPNVQRINEGIISNLPIRQSVPVKPAPASPKKPNAKRQNNINKASPAASSPAQSNTASVPKVALTPENGGMYYEGWLLDNGMNYEGAYPPSPAQKTVVQNDPLQEKIANAPVPAAIPQLPAQKTVVQNDPLQEKIANAPVPAAIPQLSVQSPKSAEPERVYYQDGTPLNWGDVVGSSDTDYEGIMEKAHNLPAPDIYDLARAAVGQAAQGMLIASPNLIPALTTPVRNFVNWSKDLFKLTPKALPEKVGGDAKLASNESIIRGPFNRGKFNPFEYFTKISSRKREAAILENHLSDLVRTGQMGTREYLIRMQRISEALKHNLPIK